MSDFGISFANCQKCGRFMKKDEVVDNGQDNYGLQKWICKCGQIYLWSVDNGELIPNDQIDWSEHKRGD